MAGRTVGNIMLIHHARDTFFTEPVLHVMFHLTCFMFLTITLYFTLYLIAACHFAHHLLGFQYNKSI